MLNMAGPFTGKSRRTLFALITMQNYSTCQAPARKYNNIEADL